MDPSPSGRRHPRAGSISVAELIGQHPRPVRVPPPHLAEADRLVEELLGPAPTAEEDEEEGPRRVGRVARIVGLTVGALVLCGAVAAAAMITGSPPHGGATTATPSTPSQISGVAALRPDVLDGGLTGRRDTAVATGAATAGATRTPGAATTTAMTPTPTRVGGPTSTTSGVGTRPITTDPSAGGLGSGVEVVREFYRLLAVDPNAAFALLDPGLPGGDATGFATSWRGVRAVRLEDATPRLDGAVEARTAIQQADGGWLRVRQLLFVSETNPPRITGARLLSAQRG
ncbi:hypothetical protein [Streptoalloteichus hindustanus]|uniref:Uncharacterized protein n=1 Tax=Streptoalloteichus hindustanus TaxID=2017 RepID=A0A1M5KGV6_STRHI|nr:hypothetical protein [Streptoalloteichus hindustanus]SHG52174.1 hypothetical protein SAMN05444320_109277 [Streptoalloteichus hindustanus]